MRLLKQSILIILSFLFVFVWQYTPLSSYTIQILGFFIAIFLILSAFKKSSRIFGQILESQNSWSIFFLASIVLLLIFSTGGINSNLFFLLYFLCFGIAFVFEPLTVFIFVISALLVFFPAAIANDVMSNSIKLGSLVLISPLAFFFGREFRQEEKQDRAIETMREYTRQAADKIENDVNQIEKDQNLSPDGIDKLDEIKEEAQELREDTK